MRGEELSIQLGATLLNDERLAARTAAGFDPSAPNATLGSTTREWPVCVDQRAFASGPGQQLTVNPARVVGDFGPVSHPSGRLAATTRVPCEPPFTAGAVRVERCHCRVCLDMAEQQELLILKSAHASI
jgi:hypothetical protein